MKPFSEVISDNTLTLVDFYATWCGPCQTMKPILEELKGRIGEKAKILKIDVDRNAQTAQAYRIQSVPTLILFKGGHIVWRASGVTSADALQQLIDRQSAA